jgi:hypothetical protein
MQDYKRIARKRIESQQRGHGEKLKNFSATHPCDSTSTFSLRVTNLKKIEAPSKIGSRTEKIKLCGGMCFDQKCLPPQKLMDYQQLLVLICSVSSG